MLGLKFSTTILNKRYFECHQSKLRISFLYFLLKTRKAGKFDPQESYIHFRIKNVFLIKRKSSLYVYLSTTDFIKPTWYLLTQSQQ